MAFEVYNDKFCRNGCGNEKLASDYFCHWAFSSWRRPWEDKSLLSEACQAAMSLLELCIWVLWSTTASWPHAPLSVISSQIVFDEIKFLIFLYCDSIKDERWEVVVICNFALQHRCYCLFFSEFLCVWFCSVEHLSTELTLCSMHVVRVCYETF